LQQCRNCVAFFVFNFANSCLYGWIRKVFKSECDMFTVCRFNESRFVFSKIPVDMLGPIFCVPGCVAGAIVTRMGGDARDR